MDERVWNNLSSFKILLGSSPDTKRPIVTYLAVSKEAVSTTLVQELEKEEQLVYFISRVLHNANVSYQMIEKVALALVVTARKMWMYFQSHCIIVKIDYPIMKILAKPDLAGRMIGWADELSEFQIQYQPRGVIKFQALADFTTELNPFPTEVDDLEWTWHVDGSSNNNSCGAGIVLKGSSSILLKQALKFDFDTSNNQIG